ncbi:VanZ family protein [Craterilacuibacter sp. RT1T]|uniref:VanZ family protein n=1 Tax=Craterilacuibacter sp. RT1T TaxID=2942211 RepID=UPI0020C02B1D|nr:VanZ family protein [Craterilacuibacter sp. RT1T]MCL6264698.1 VanZ family protein [Craterilacuibacter sp. RT1T]
MPPLRMTQLFMLLTLLWWGFSLYMLLKPASTEPSLIPYFDKIGHFCLFAVQALVLRLALPQQAWPRILLMLALWAVLSETLQGVLTTDRSPELADAGADILGAATALWALRMLRCTLSSSLRREK